MKSFSEGDAIDTQKETDDARAAHGSAAKRWLRAASYLPVYVALIILLCALWERPVVLTLIFVPFTAFLLWRWHSRSDVFYFFAMASLGPLAEAFAVHFGAWTYTRPWIGIPLWLPFAWGIAGLYIKRTAEALTGDG